VRAEGRALLAAIYRGEILRRPPSEASLALARACRAILNASDPAALERLDDAAAQRALSELRAQIGDHPAISDAIALAAVELGMDPARLAFDAPRLRAVRPAAHLLPAARPAFSVHRDTWYANPRAQLNWWLALEPIPAERGLLLYPGYFSRPVPNDSAGFDFDEFSRKIGWQNYTPRRSEAIYPTTSLDLSREPGLAFALEAGELLLFSAAQLHCTQPNRSQATRYSIDWRTVCLDDHNQDLGAPNVDNRSRGSALETYRRGCPKNWTAVH
jgi:hypothetical protein